MINILLVSNCFPLNTRNVRIIKSLKSFPNINVRYCAWRRDSSPYEETSDLYIYSSNVGYKNKIYKIIGILKYYRYLNNIINIYRPDVIIASFWDMLVLSRITKHACIIYDVIDIPSSKIFLFQFLFLFLERVFIQNVSGVILASRYYEVISLYKKYKPLVFENYPSQPFRAVRSTIRSQSPPFSSLKPLRLAFVGLIRYPKTLKLLIDSISNLNISLLFYGTGPYEEEIRRYAKKKENILFFGKYDYHELPDIYNTFDLLWAVYPSRNRNVRYAISNKYYETLLYKIPGIYSERTFLGKHVSDNQLGFAVNEKSRKAVSSLLKLLVDKRSLINNAIYNLNKINCKDILWENNQYIYYNYIMKSHLSQARI